MSSSSVNPCALSAVPSASNDLGAKPMPNRSAAAWSNPRCPRKSRPICARRRRELLAEERLGRRVRRQQPRAVAVIACLTAVFVVQLEADAGGHALHRLLEGDVIHLLQEGEDVAALAASEAVVEPDLGPDVEARRALFVERAETLERADAGALQGDVVAHDIREVDASPDLVDVASANEAGHDPILGSTDVARLAGQNCVINRDARPRPSPRRR